MRYIVSMILTLFVLKAGFGQTPKEAFNLSSKQLAIDGYDPVSYFTKNTAIKGRASITTIESGITYQFSSQENKTAFLASPEKYQPQYGGWCAYAMGATAEKVEVDPETFKIVNGKLYLFYNQFFNNTLRSWNKDEAGLMKKANANWLKFYH